MRDLRRARGARNDLPPVLYVTLGSADATRDFFAEFDPDAGAVADPEKVLFSAFGLERGSVGQLLSPSVLAAGLRALVHGNLPGIPSGDVRQLSGEFLVRGDTVRGDTVRGDTITWAYRAADASDHPELDDVARAAAESERARPT